MPQACGQWTAVFGGSRRLHPADIAVVEDVTGGSLEALLDRDPMAAERPLSAIADWLAAMSTVRSPSLGKVAFVNAGGRSLWTTTKLNRGGLDEDRLRFYQLCMNLNLVAGPLRMADTSHPEHAWFRRLAEHHLQLVLQFQA